MWHEAQVRDESLMGIGLLVANDVQCAGGDVVEIDYLGDIRQAA